MYLIVTKRTIHHEGDQRSRDFPGHGYPAYSETLESVKIIKDKETLNNSIRDLLKYKTEFAVYSATKLNVKVGV